MITSFRRPSGFETIHRARKRQRSAGALLQPSGPGCEAVTGSETPGADADRCSTDRDKFSFVLI